MIKLGFIIFLSFFRLWYLKWNSMSNTSETIRKFTEKNWILNLGSWVLILNFSVLNLKRRRRRSLPKSMLWFLLIWYYWSSLHFILSVNFTSDTSPSRHKSLGWTTPAEASFAQGRNLWEWAPNGNLDSCFPSTIFFHGK